ncbi:MAG: ChaN family lipoprotein, partial [Phycisphaerales bacterium]
MRTITGLAGAMIGVLVAGTVPGCGTQTRDNSPAGAVRAGDFAQPTRQQARSVMIRRGDGSGSVPWAEVVDQLAGSDVVLFGEVHGHPLGNRVQQELFEDVLLARPGTILSMEFYERDDQIALDDYLSGVTDCAAFDEAA